MTALPRPTQTDRLHDWLVERGTAGVHTFEMRCAFMGNPSQRRQDLEDRGVAIVVGPRERLNGDARGVRMWLAEHAPSTAAAALATEVDRHGCFRMAV